MTTGTDARSGLPLPGGTAASNPTVQLRIGGSGLKSRLTDRPSVAQGFGRDLRWWRCRMAAVRDGLEIDWMAVACGVREG